MDYRKFVPQIASKKFERFIKKNGILHIKSAPTIRLHMDAQKDLLQLLKTLLEKWKGQVI